MVHYLPTIQGWLNRILALPIALQNAIFDEFMALVEARIDAAREAGTLDLGLETIRVDDFEVVADTLLRADPVSGATTHLLEINIKRAVRPLTLERLEAQFGIGGDRARPMRNARSGRVALFVPARSIMDDEGTRLWRFELIRPVSRSYLRADQLEESSWEQCARAAFDTYWREECLEATATPKTERHYLATRLLLPVWDKLPSDFVRVSRISAKDGRSLLGREVPMQAVAAFCEKLGQNQTFKLDPHDVVQSVLATGQALSIGGRDGLMLKRALVNGRQRLELAGWSAARLDWYKAEGCFTEIIRYQTRLFVPLDRAADIVQRLGGA